MSGTVTPFLDDALSALLMTVLLITAVVRTASRTKREEFRKRNRWLREPPRKRVRCAKGSYSVWLLVIFTGSGKNCLINCKYDDAIKHFNKAAGIDNKHVVAFIGLGSAYFGKKEYKEALKNFKTAIHLDSNSVDAYIKRGYAHFRKEQIEDAIKDYDRAITLDPKNAEAYFLRSQAHYLNGLRLAIINCEQSLHLNSDNCEAREWITYLLRSSRAFKPF